jgi:hypothetical protein
MHKLCGQVVVHLTGVRRGPEFSSTGSTNDEIHALLGVEVAQLHYGRSRTMPERAEADVNSRLAKKISSSSCDSCDQGKLEDSTTADGASRLATNAYLT